MLGILSLDIILLVVFLLVGIPLPFCFGGALVFMAFFGGTPIRSMMLWGFNQMISLTVLAGPIFILTGTLISESGIAKRLLALADLFAGRIRGMIGVIAVLTCGFLGAVSGSGFTGVAAVGPIMIPEMEKRGYSRGFATSLISAATILGLLIPPSVSMIWYGWVTGTSILAAFLSTVGPAILIMILLSIVNLIYARKYVGEPQSLIAGCGNRRLSKKALGVFYEALPGLLMPIIILGGIYGGICTPTESAAIAAVLALIIGVFIYKELNLKITYKVLVETATSIGAIMTMIFFCLMLSQVFVMLKIPQKLIELFATYAHSKILVLLFVNIFLLFIGMIVNDTTAIVLCAPILLPLVSHFGVSSTQFAAIIGVNLGIGGITPPYASLLYLGMRVGNAEFSEVIIPTYILLLTVFLPVLFLTTYWEPLSLFIPKMLGY